MMARDRLTSHGAYWPRRAAQTYLAVLVSVAAALVAFLPASTAFSGTSGLVAAYGFENGSGSTVSDTSGNGNDGVLTSGSWASAGVFGHALRVNGSGVGVVVNDAPALHLKHELTLEAWVKPSGASGDWRDVVYKGDSNYFLDATSNSNGVPAAGVGFNGDGLGASYGTAPLPSSTWTYLAATYDGSELRLYVDGDEVSSIPETATIRSSANPLEIGGDHIYGHFFSGLIDEVRIYDVARSADDVRSDMTQPVVSGTAPADTQPPSAPSGLTATAASPGEIDLSWAAATDASSLIYQLQRCSGSGCTDFAPLATAAATSFADTTVTADTTYTYRVRAVDAAGNIGPFSDTAEATTPPLSSPAGPGPLTVAPSGRYLLDENGKPFLLMGDSPQALIGNLTESDANVYFASRRAEGFNTVWINLLCNSYTGCRGDGSTWDGVPPFTTPGDFSTPNEAYFARVDNMIRLAGQYGLVVLLDPAETGGWLGTMEANGIDKLRAYGQYLGTRYRDFPNIIWMHGNDFQNWGPSTDPYVTAVAIGIGDTDTRHLQTVELDYPTSGSLDDPAWAPLIQLNASYTYDPTYMQVLTDYNRTNFLPTFMVEANYEFEQNLGPPGGTPLQLRRQEYWTMLSGATGQLYGNHYTWQFLCPQRDGAGDCIGGWKDELDTPGQTEFGYVKQLFESLRWYDLIPDQNHAVVTGGFGTYGTDDYATAASTSDGKLAIVYMPSSRTITVDLSRLAGTVTARWYDPSAGTFATDSGSPYANAGSQQFAPPGPNAAGDGDWVLVLEAS